MLFLSNNTRCNWKKLSHQDSKPFTVLKLTNNQCGMVNSCLMGLESCQKAKGKRRERRRIMDAMGLGVCC